MKRRYIPILIISVILVTVGVTVFACHSSQRLLKEYSKDIYLTSDDGEHTIIIREWGTIGGTALRYTICRMACFQQENKDRRYYRKGLMLSLP